MTSPRSLHALFLVSGALALAHEVTWMRRFTELFGATAPSVAVTIASVFLGIALGSKLGGAAVARTRRPVRAFALLEIGVGLGALATPLVLSLFEDLPATSLALQAAAAIVSVLLPAACMGATLPVLGEALASPDHLGIGAGALYALNTAGAVAGALAVPYVLLPQLGLLRTTLALSAGSVLVGALALLFGDTPRPAVASSHPAPVARRLLALAALSGALTLGLETVATRLLSFVHESSTHAFAIVLAAFLAGLAAGAAVARTLLRRGVAAGVVAAAGWWGGALLVGVLPLVLVLGTRGLRPLQGPGAAATLVVLALALVGLPALSLGLVLPALMEAAGGSRPGRVLGSLLAANTLGAVAGPLVVTFVAIPAIGSWATVPLLATLMAAGAALHRPASVRAIAAVLVIACGGALAVRSAHVAARRPGERVVATIEGFMGRVEVVERDGGRRLRLDNAYTIGGTLSTPDERLQALLPLLLHESPQRVAFLGLGTGITAGAISFLPAQADVVELVPEVAEAARLHFADANLRVLQGPDVTLHLDDARPWLRARHGAYDVIVGDLFVPWRRGEASLYTLDHFREVRDALAPGGLACQWLPAYQLSEMELRSIVRTFAEVFPDAELWRGDFHPDEPALALVGWTARPASLREVVARRLGMLRPDPANPQLVHEAAVFMHLVGPVSSGHALLEGVPLNTRDRPRVELRTLPRDARRSLLEALDAQPLPPSQETEWREAGRALWQAAVASRRGRAETAQERIEEAASKLPADVRGSLGLP